MPPALEILQVITPSILSLPLLSLALPSRAAPAELPGIRAITVKTVTPRRGFILLTLVLLAATCAAEALILISDILTARYRDPSNRHSHSAWYVAAGAAHSIGGLCVYSLAAIFAEYRLRWGDKSLVLLALAAFGLEVPNLVLAVIREVHARK
jgi:ATP-binding cassette subfamily B (MDR/TAP) protein 6